MKVKLLFAYTVFLVFTSQMTALGAPTLFKGVVDNPEQLVCRPEGIVETVGCFFQNLGIFFKMFSISSEFAILSSIILTPFFVILIYIIVEWIISLIPG